VVRLTDRGRAAVQVLRTLLDEVDEEWRRVLGEDDYQVLRSALGRLHDHLGETRADEQSDDAT
jgi:DNA-binding MarR family transcriptional regulator